MSITVKQFSVNADLDSVLASSITASRYLGFRIDSRSDEVLLRGSRGPNWMNFGESISAKVISNSSAACILEVTCTVMFVDVWGRSSVLLSNFQTLMLKVLEKRADSDTSVPSFNMYSACRTVFVIGALMFALLVPLAMQVRGVRLVNVIAIWFTVLLIILAILTFISRVQRRREHIQDN
jgi:hypothetical protein